MTPADERRYQRLADIGCLACRKRGLFSFPDIHHQNFDGKAGQRRLGNKATVPLCPWHHRGIPPGIFTSKDAREAMGPSLASQSRAFREEFGSDGELLAWANSLLAEVHHARTNHQETGRSGPGRADPGPGEAET